MQQSDSASGWAEGGRATTVVLIVAAFLLVYGAASLPLWDPDEARFARTSLEMMRSGDLVVPTFGAEPRLVKPPFLHWIQAALFSALGASAWVARLPAMLAALATVGLTAGVARRRFGGPAAFWAAATLATMPLLYAVGRQGTLDALLTLHVFAVVAYDLQLGDDPDGGASGFVYGLLAGLAFLIKGPVGVSLPLLMILAGRTASGRHVAPTLRGGAAAALAWAMTVLPWGIAFLTRVGGEAATTLREQVLARVFVGTDHVEPAWYYLPVLLVACMPWLAPLLAAFGRTLRGAVDPATRTARYLAAACLAGLALLSASRGKSPNYLLPLLPPAALLLSWELSRELEAPRRRFRAASLLAATLGAFAVAAFVFASRPGAGELALPARVAGALLGAGMLACLPALLRRRPARVWLVAAVAQAAFLATVVVTVPPRIADTRSSEALTHAVPELFAADEVVVVDMKVPSLLWYLDRIPREVALAHLEPPRADGTKRLWVFDRRDWERVSAETKPLFREIGSAGKYAVFEASVPEPLDAPRGPS